jgi:hypothetical protein
VLDVPPLPGDTYIQLPFMAPTNTDSVSNYTLMMDVYAPNDSTNPVTLFNLSNSDAGGQHNLSLLLTPGALGGVLSLDTTIGGLPVNLVSPMPVTPGAWNRVALVVFEVLPGQEEMSLYVNGKDAGSTTFDATPGALAFNPDSLATVLSSPQGTAGESYVSSIQWHGVAMAPEMMASIGDTGVPMSANDPSAAGAPPVMSATVSGGVVNFSWSGSAFQLQEASDLTSGVWMDSVLPFDQVEVNGDILTTSHATPPLQGPTRFYRLIFKP